MASDDPLQVRLGDALRERGWTVATAESFTGGLVGHLITEVAGCSAYYAGGIVAYSNEAKENLLGVERSTLERHGAVSGETALEMARGARRVLRADLAVSITGIAGPSGGTPDKPVGTTWIAASAPGQDLAELHVWCGDRSQNKDLSARAALDLALRILESRP